MSVEGWVCMHVCIPLKELGDIFITDEPVGAVLSRVDPHILAIPTVLPSGLFLGCVYHTALFSAFHNAICMFSHMANFELIKVKN